MTILDSPPKEWLANRPDIPKPVKQAVLRRQGLRCAETGDPLAEAKRAIHFDHRPGLWERKFDTETDDTVPPANDPLYIDALTVKGHDLRTHGPGGEKRITTAGSDTGRRTKGRKTRAKEAAHRERMANKATGDIPETSEKWFKKAKVRWPKGRKLQSRNTLKRRGR